MRYNSLFLTTLFILFTFASAVSEEAPSNSPVSEMPAGVPVEPAQVVLPPDEDALKADYKGPRSVIIRYLGGFTANISGATFGWVDQIYVDNKRDELYLLDKANKRIVITDSNGIYLYHFDYTLSKVSSPFGLSVDSNGDIYVFEGNKIIVLNYRGVFKKELDLSAIPDKDDMTIQSIAFSSVEGRWLYIGDNKKGRIIVLSKDGKFIKEYGRDVIKARNFDDIYVDEQGFIFLDGPGHTVYRYNHDGKLVRKWGKLTGLLGGFSMPVGMMVDAKNKRVIVVDTNRTMVVVFDMLGNPLFEFGGPRVFSWPRAVAVSSDGHIYVADNTGVIRVFEAMETIDEPPSQMPAEETTEEKGEGE